MKIISLYKKSVFCWESLTIGLCAASETLLGAIAGIICSGIILGLSVAFQIAMLAYSLPFLNVEVPENLANFGQWAFCNNIQFLNIFGTVIITV